MPTLTGNLLDLIGGNSLIGAHSLRARIGHNLKKSAIIDAGNIKLGTFPIAVQADGSFSITLPTGPTGTQWQVTVNYNDPGKLSAFQDPGRTRSSHPGATW